LIRLRQASGYRSSSDSGRGIYTLRQEVYQLSDGTSFERILLIEETLKTPSAGVIIQDGVVTENRDVEDVDSLFRLFNDCEKYMTIKEEVSQI